MKQYLASNKGCQPAQIYHVTVEPCYDKKLEASRSDFFNQNDNSRDVDCVITSRKFNEGHHFLWVVLLSLFFQGTSLYSS